MNAKIKFIQFLFITVLISVASSAQVKTSIRGKVVDEKGAPIFAASVYLNTNQGLSLIHI